MSTRKELKKRAKRVLRTHYGLLVTVCLVATLLGAECTGSLDLIKQYRIDAQGSSISAGAVMGDYRNKSTALDAVFHALSGDLDTGAQISQELTEEAVESSQSSRMLGRSRGVLADLVNRIDSGGLLVTVVAALRSIGVSRNGVLVLSVLGAMVFFTFLWFFVQRTYRVISRRIFLESRIYPKVPVQRFAMLLRPKRWANVAATMFMTSLLEWLWSLTILGAPVKRYAYYLVPYIVAENPDIRWRDAITLSRRMMHGHKWECFCMELTFLPWELLGGLTLGLLDLFFTAPYKAAAFAEYYAALRESGRERATPGIELLQDRYLYQQADQETLRAAYGDILALREKEDDAALSKGGFLASVLGVTLRNDPEERRRQEEEARRSRAQVGEDILAGQSYPTRLSPALGREKDAREESIHYRRRYSLPNLILLFFIFSVVGWVWEVSLSLIFNGEFANRGVLHGPWLPIYGTGGVLILVALYRLRGKPVLEFCAAILLCGAVEYLMACWLEWTHDGMKWWDYSGYFLNLNGRICAEGLLVFGLGGMAVVYLVAPLLDDWLRRIRPRVAVTVCAVLLVFYVGDQLYSSVHPNQGRGITDIAPPQTVSSAQEDLARGDGP